MKQSGDSVAKLPGRLRLFLGSHLKSCAVADREGQHLCVLHTVTIGGSCLFGSRYGEHQFRHETIDRWIPSKPCQARLFYWWTWRESNPRPKSTHYSVDMRKGAMVNSPPPTDLYRTGTVVNVSRNESPRQVIPLLDYAGPCRLLQYHSGAYNAA